jgi:hypothetical protein
MIPMDYTDVMRAITIDRIAHQIDSSNQKLMEAMEQYQAHIKDKPEVKHIKLHNYMDLNAMKTIAGITLSLRPSAIFKSLAEEEYYPYVITERSNMLPSFSNPKPEGGGTIKIYKTIEEDTESSLDENIGKYVRMMVRYEATKPPVYKKQYPVGYAWSRVPLKLLKDKELFAEHIFSEYDRAIKEALKYTP